MYRKDLFDQAGAEPPKNADDLLALGKQLTDAKAGRWAFGSVADEVIRSFGAPGGWRKDSSGKLVNKIETPEYAEPWRSCAGCSSRATCIRRSSPTPARTRTRCSRAASC